MEYVFLWNFASSSKAFCSSADNEPPVSSSDPLKWSCWNALISYSPADENVCSAKINFHFVRKHLREQFHQYPKRKWSFWSFENNAEDEPVKMSAFYFQSYKTANQPFFAIWQFLRGGKNVNIDFEEKRLPIWNVSFGMWMFNQRFTISQQFKRLHIFPKFFFWHLCVAKNGCSVINFFATIIIS